MVWDGGGSSVERVNKGGAELRNGEGEGLAVYTIEIDENIRLLIDELYFCHPGYLR